MIFVGVECHAHSFVIFFPLKSDDKMTKDKLRFLSIYSWKEVKMSYIVGVYSEDWSKSYCGFFHPVLKCVFVCM